MKNLELYEQASKRTIILKSKQGRTITFDVEFGKIENIENHSGIRFPYHEGTHYNMNIETWCCNNGFTMNGEDMCPEKKVFGMRPKDIPVGHELRSIFPNKFRKR